MQIEVELERVSVAIIGITPEQMMAKSGVATRRIRVTYLVDVGFQQDVVCVKHNLVLHENGDITFPDEPDDFKHLKSACKMMFGLSAKLHFETFVAWIQDLGKSEVYSYGSLIRSVNTWLNPDNFKDN